LRPCAASEEGTAKLLQALEKTVDHDEFVQWIAREQENAQVGTAGSERSLAPSRGPDASSTADRIIGDEVLHQEWWEPCDSSFYFDRHISEKSTECNNIDGQAKGNVEDDGYVMVEHEDVIQSMAEFLAAYLVSLPESRTMDPLELQRAVKLSLGELRKGKVQRIWDWGKLAYRAAALSYGAFAAYTNPWVAEAIVRGVFTCVRFARALW
jgi:hypothetical protein